MSLDTNITSNITDHTNATAGHDESGHGGHVPGEATITLYVFVGLLLGCIFREINKKLKVPYTPALLGVGILIGYFNENLGMVGEATVLMSHIEPHGILMIFIPTLIFESGMNIEWYVFKKAFKNILLLAGPGVLYGAFLLAGGLKWIIGYTDDDLTWPGALTLGSIISTTDPVAVVALLKQMGAPVPLNTLIEGESLLNDGVAMVFFTLFASITKGEDTSPGQVLWNFITLAGGGPLLGILMGIIGTMWLQRVLRDSVLGVTLTFIMCYMAFFIAEFLDLHLSGILAIVSLGLFMSAYGKTSVDPEGEHALHSVWAWVQYACETIIFLLTGCIIGIFLHSSQGSLTSSDWFDLVIFYIIMTVARMIMIVTFMPMLSKSGYGLTWKESLVVCYGGLRGALGLALALIVAVDDGFTPRTRALVLFHMAGMATITLLVNGSTCSLLVRYLGIVQESEVRQRLKTNFMAELLIASGKRFEDIKSHKYLNLCDWQKARQLIGIDEMLTEIHRTEQLEQHAPKQGALLSYHAFKDEDIYAEARYRLLRVMKGLVWEKYEESLLTGPAARLLNEAVEMSLDNNRKPIAIWEFLYSIFTGNKLLNFYIKVKDLFLIGLFARKSIVHHLSFLYQVITTFVIIAEEVIEHQSDVPLSKEHIKVVVEELEKNKCDASNYVISLQDQFSDTIKNIQVRRAAYNVLFFQRQQLDRALKEGQIEDKEYNELRREIDRRIVGLDDSLAFTEWAAPTFNDFVMQFPMFSSLRRDEIDAIKSSAQMRIFQNGQSLFSKGNKIEGIFVITKGIVRQYLDLEKNSTKHGLGSILSFCNIISDDHLALSNCVAAGEVHAQFLSASVVEDVMRRNYEFETVCYKNSLYHFVKYIPQTAGELIVLDEQAMLLFINKARLVKIERGIKFQISTGGYLFKGEIRKSDNTLRLNKPGYVPASEDEYICENYAVYLIFDIEVKQFLAARRNSVEAGHPHGLNHGKISLAGGKTSIAGVEGPRAKKSVYEEIEHEKVVKKELENMYGGGVQQEKQVLTNKNGIIA